jgi:hypothetical protein
VLKVLTGAWEPPQTPNNNLTCMEVRIVAAQIVSEPFSLDERLDLACSAATEIGLLADSLLDQLVNCNA